MTGKFGVDGDFMTRMVMCARTPFFLTTRKAMTLGGDSSRAAIARSSAIRETKRLASIELAHARDV